MKTRTELFSIFQKTHAKIRTRFNNSIHILRSSNAKEYFSTSFSSFMPSYGILHQSSYAYTPQQNGVAKCKNRHLVEIIPTLLLHHKVHQRFWGDVILAACYLINRMSSSVLHDQIPHSVYYLINHSFASLLMSLVVFVLFIFSLLGKTNSQPKPRSVFLGYFRLQRGYRCYSPDTNRYFIVMSFSLRIPPPPLQRILLFQMSYLFLLSYHLPISLVHLKMSCLDHFRFILIVLILLQGLLLTHLLCRNHLLIRFRNPLLIYLLSFGKAPALLLTHILFVIFSTFIVYLYPTLSLFQPCLLSLPLRALVRLSPTNLFRILFPSSL